MKQVSSTLQALQQQSRMVEDQARSIAQSALRSYDSTLKNILKNAANTLQQDITQHNQKVTQLLEVHRQKLSEHLKTQRMVIRTEITNQVRRTLWLVRIPFTATAVILVMLTLLAFWLTPLSSLHYETQTVMIGSEKYQYVTDPQWTVCRGDRNHLYPCRKLEK